MTPQLTSDLRDAVQRQHGGPLCVDGDYVVMSVDVYRELMGVGSDEEFEASVQAVKEGLDDVRAGRTRPLREFLDELGREHEVSR